MADVDVMLLKAPQALALPQVTDQVTPAFLGSLVTVVVSATAVLVASEAGEPLSATEMAVIVMLAEADFVVSVTEAAVTVTVFPVGTVAGGV